MRSDARERFKKGKLFVTRDHFSTISSQNTSAFSLAVVLYIGFKYQVQNGPINVYNLFIKTLAFLNI